MNIDLHVYSIWTMIVRLV